MSDPAESSASSEAAKSRSGGGTSQSQRVTNAILGTFVLLAILVLANYVFGRVNLRLDLTENKIFTLTDGTKSVLEELDKNGTAVTLRFYAVTDSDYVSQFYLTRATAVEDFLKEYENRAGGAVTVKRYNPEPFSDDAESAKFDGLPRGVFDDPDNPVYFGIAVESEGRKEVLPFLPARREELLEYDVTRAILRVSNAARPKVRIMTSMEIGGGFSGNFGAPPTPPWYLVKSLQRDYDVEFVQPSAPEIADDTDVLIVLHPYDLVEDAQFAIDQYLLKGGRVLVTVDPLFFAARYMSQGGGNPMMMQQPPQGPGPSSDLNKLFAAWGVKFDSQLVLADMASQTRIASGYSPTVLSVPDSAMNADDPVTAQLSDLFMITPGAFEVLPVPGVEATVLVSSSEQSQLVGTFDADPTQREAMVRLRQNFKPDGKERALMARFSGTFKSAFPDGLGGGDAMPAPGGATAPVGEPVVPKDEDEDDEEVEKPDAKPADAKPADAKPADAKPADAKPADAKPADAKPADAKPADAKPADAKPADAKPADAKPADAKPADAKPADAKPETGGPEDDEAAAEAGADSAAPDAPAALKSSEKDGIVVVISDSDFVYDNFSVQQVRNMEDGSVEMQPVNSNLALFENALEQLAGGDELIRVRSRASNRRPFTRLNDILEDVESEFRPELEKVAAEVSRIDGERQAISQNILRIISQNPGQAGEEQMSRELGEQILKLQEQEEEMAEQETIWKRKEYEVNKEIKREFESAKNGIILLVTAALPLIIIIFGIALAVNQRVRTAAQ